MWRYTLLSPGLSLFLSLWGWALTATVCYSLLSSIDCAIKRPLLNNAGLMWARVILDTLSHGCNRRIMLVLRNDSMMMMENYAEVILQGKLLVQHRNGYGRNG